MAEKTIFTRIMDGEIPGQFVYQDEDMSNLQSQCNQSLGSTTMCFEGVIIGFTN